MARATTPENMLRAKRLLSNYLRDAERGGVHYAEEQFEQALTYTITEAVEAERDLLMEHNEALKTCLEDILKAVDTGNLEMNSPEIDCGDPEIPKHRWHDEWLHSARSVSWAARLGVAAKKEE